MGRTIGRKRIGSALIAILVLASGAGTAAADCRGGASARIEVPDLPFSYVVDVGQSSSQLASQVDWPANIPNLDRSRANGMHRSNLKTSTGWRSRSMGLPDGRWCAEAAAIRIIYGNTNPETVHVANHLPVGSCAYAAVLFHELKHSQQHRRHVGYARSWLRNRFSGWSPAAVGATKEEAKAELDRNIDARTREALEYLVAFQIANATQIDTAEEYHRVNTSCGQWFDTRAYGAR